MSGFLDTLIARTEGRLPVLERRVRALFEPPTGAPVASLDLGSAVATPLAADRDPGSSPADTGGASRESARGSAPFARTLGAEPVARGGAQLQLQPVASIGPRPASVPGGARRTAEAAPTHDRPPARPRPAAAPPDGVPALRRPRAEVLPAAAPAARTAQHGELAAATPIGSLQRRAAPAPHAAVVLARVQTSAVVRRDASFAAAPAPASAPVQISIGRVEIRAVQATPDPSRASGPAAPRLSLDAYLRQRNGAAR